LKQWKHLLNMFFQHFYDFQERHHQNLIGIIMSFFQEKLFKRDPEESNLNRLTLSYALENAKQLIVVYRNCAFSSDEFFCSGDYPTPWPNVTNVDNLKEFLDKRLEFRSPYQGFVSQCVITPDPKYIIVRFYSSLKRSCAKKVDKKLSDWIASQTPGTFNEGEKPKSNVFLADFIDLRGSNFSKTVVDLNMKLIE
jgi:hypothetical protein